MDKKINMGRLSPVFMCLLKLYKVNLVKLNVLSCKISK